MIKEPIDHPGPSLTESTTSKDGSGSSIQNGEPAHQIDIPLFHQILILPFRIRDYNLPISASSGHTGRMSTERGQSDIDRWLEHLCSDKTKWQEAENFFPFDAPNDRMGEKPFDADASYARMRYAEYVYFHPFVRSFLYPTNEDAANCDFDESVDASTLRKNVRNQVLRVLKREDIRWAEVTISTDGKSSTTETTICLRVRRLELYLFESRIGTLVVELDNRPLLEDGGSEDRKRLRDHDNMQDPAHNDCGSRPLDLTLGTCPHNDESDGGPTETHEENIRRTITEKWGCGEKTCQTRQLTLAEVLQLQDSLRRIYVPYWEFNPKRPNLPPFDAGHSLVSLQWLDNVGNPIGSSSKPEESRTDTIWSDAINATRQEGEPPLLPWWKELLSPAAQVTRKFELEWYRKRIAGPLANNDRRIGNKSKERNADEAYSFAIKLLGDDRMAVMTYLAVADNDNVLGPHRIGDADWMRLAMQDAPGAPRPDTSTDNPFPFSWHFFGESAEEALCNFERQFVYDRHFAKRQQKHSSPEHSSRLLISGMGFVAVGRFGFDKKTCGDAETKDVKCFGIDPINGLLGVFRYHYFKLGLILHFQRATLLNLEDELANHVSLFQNTASGSPSFPKRRERFRNAVKQLKLEFLRFRCRYWFTETTGQLQGQEIYDRWSQHLRTRVLFEQVDQELCEAEEILSREREDEENELTRQLTLVATVFLPVALLIPILNSLMPERFMWASLGATCLVCLGTLAILLSRSGSEYCRAIPKNRLREPVRKWLTCEKCWKFLGWSMLLIAVVLFGGCYVADRCAGGNDQQSQKKPDTRSSTGADVPPSSSTNHIPVGTRSAPTSNMEPASQSATHSTSKSASESPPDTNRKSVSDSKPIKKSISQPVPKPAKESPVPPKPAGTSSATAPATPPVASK